MAVVIRRVDCFTIFLVTEILIKNFENGAYLITIFSILSVIINFNLLAERIIINVICLIACIWAEKSGSEDRMYVWRKESYYIWVGTREKIDDNMGIKVSSTHFNVFWRRVAGIKWHHIQGEIWFCLMFLRIEFSFVSWDLEILLNLAWFPKISTNFDKYINSVKTNIFLSHLFLWSSIHIL